MTATTKGIIDFKRRKALTQKELAERGQVSLRIIQRIENNKIEAREGTFRIWQLVKSINVVIVLSLFLWACDVPRKEYYPNGNLKRTFKIVNGEYEGEYKEYYESGNLKWICQFEKGRKVDSSVYYADSRKETIEKVCRELNDSIQYVLFFNEQGDLTFEGKSFKDEERIGKWKYYKKEYDSIVEYKIVDAATYTNQIWVINRDKDTLASKSNYFDFYCGGKDTLSLNDVLRVSIMLVEPHYGYDSDIEVLIPEDDRNLKGDFSNIREIKMDTIKSIKNDGISNEGIPEDVPINHIVEFGLQFEKPGKKNIRGFIAEYIKQDSLTRRERRLFFDKEIFVGDKVGSK